MTMSAQVLVYHKDKSAQATEFVTRAQVMAKSVPANEVVMHQRVIVSAQMGVQAIEVVIHKKAMNAQAQAMVNAQMVNGMSA